MQDSGKPEDAGTARPEDAGTEATRESISRRRGREDSRKLESLNLRQSRKVQGTGKPATNTGRRRWKSGAEGKPGVPAPEAPKDARFGVTRISVAGTAGRRRNRGDPGTDRQAQTEEQSYGDARSLGAGCAEGCEIRGDSKIHRRQGRKMQTPGQLGDSSVGVTGTARLWGNLELKRQMR
jgi:hypothetical protein